MARASLASRRIVGDDRDAFPDDLNGMIATKLWDNPCWLSFRINYIAHHFNQPVYDWIWREYALTRPEYMAIYALGLRDGVTAEDIVAAGTRPKNTLSRAVKSLLRKGLIHRRQSGEDRRRYHLFLAAPGRAIIARSVPVLVAHERKMAEALTAPERATLANLMTKLILKAGEWPADITRET
jgi:DNA-binding MarR family transcriptional regulator